MDEIISYKMCAVKVRNAKLRNYLKTIDNEIINQGWIYWGGGGVQGVTIFHDKAKNY